MEWQDKVVVVTGGLGSAGSEVTRYLLQAGARVAVLDLEIGDGAGRVAELAPSAHRALYVPVDLADSGQATAAFARVAEEFGGMNALINCVGEESAPASEPTIDKLTDTDIQTVFATNVYTIVHSCKEALPYLRQNPTGVIVNLGGIASRMATAQGVLYSATKAAVTAFTRELAAELWAERIRCITLSTGTFVSRSTEELMTDDEWHREQLGRVLAGRLMEPGDVAEVACFLASDLSQAINGSEVFLDGGGMFFRDRPSEPGFSAAIG